MVGNVPWILGAEYIQPCSMTSRDHLPTTTDEQIQSLREVEVRDNPGALRSTILPAVSTASPLVCSLARTHQAESLRFNFEF